jgi:hypothetical protein
MVEIPKDLSIMVGLALGYSAPAKKKGAGRIFSA